MLEGSKGAIKNTHVIISSFGVTLTKRDKLKYLGLVTSNIS